jgi:hypothetical protein
MSEQTTLVVRGFTDPKRAMEWGGSIMPTYPGDPEHWVDGNPHVSIWTGDFLDKVREEPIRFTDEEIERASRHIDEHPEATLRTALKALFPNATFEREP